MCLLYGKNQHGRTVLEAEAAGTAIITTDSGGIPEYVSSESAIILKRDHELTNKLADSILTLLNDDKKRRKMGNEGIRIANKYDSNRYYKEIMQILSEVEQ